MSSLVPSEAAIQAFEALKQGHVEGLFSPGLLTGEQIIAGLLLRLTQQQDALYQAQTGKPSPAPSPVAPLQTVLAVTFALEPQRLNEILIATPDIRGYLTGSANQFPTLVLAGGSATVAVPPPPGYVTSVIGDVALSTTDVSAMVQVQATLDNHPIVGAAGYLIGPSTRIRSGQYNYAQDTGIEVVFTNSSSSDVTIWFAAELLAITKSFYDKFIAPLENASYNAIKAAYNLGS